MTLSLHLRRMRSRISATIISIMSAYYYFYWFSCSLKEIHIINWSMY
jgi:hypothetical protein